MNYSIRDIEKITGIKTHTIRIWEQRYELIKPQRTVTNIRYYSDEDLKYLINVALLNKTGHKISKIAKMPMSEVYNSIHSVAINESSEQYYINELIKATIDMNEDQAEDIISSCIRRIGFPDTIEKILFPFLSRIGFLWHTSSVNVAQEHMMSNIIRRKILVATDGLVRNINNSLKTIVLFSPEWENHELGLLYCNYNLRRLGYKIIYLGVNMPIKDIDATIELTKPDCLLGFLTMQASDRKMSQFLDHYSDIQGVKKFISCHKENKAIGLAAKKSLDITIVEDLAEMQQHLQF